MINYIIVDTANMFFRAKHVVRGDSLDTKIGMCWHIMFSSINKAWKQFHGNHVVFCLEGRSWRRSVYDPYKRNRDAVREALTPKEQEEDEVFWNAFIDFQTFLREKTNCTVLQDGQCEADDFIAQWIYNHPKDRHVIVSSDSDFYQLISDNVRQYNGIMKHIITIDGYYDDSNKELIDKKTGEHRKLAEPEWLLFEKCMRGDTSDNIFSAYPGVRKKGSKNKVGLIEAFADRHNRGFDWNNLMLQRWVDHEGNEHRVLEDYERNRMLVDLTQQPDEIKQALNETIDTVVNKDPIQNVGLHFMRFCGVWDLQRISTSVPEHAEYLNAKYVN